MKLRLRKKKEIAKINYVLPDCLNCGKPLAPDDNFCSYCGQKNIEKLSFGSFLGQLVSGFFNYDSRFWRTFSPLLLKPGKVSRDYIEGKRKRYVNPFQLYLHVSILFFLILGLTNSFENPVNIPDDIEISAVNLDSILPKDVKDELFKDLDSVDQKAITSLTEGFKVSDILKDSTYQFKIKQDSIIKISFSDKIRDFHYYQEENDSIISATVALQDLGYPVTFWNTFYFQQMQKIKTNIKELINDKGQQFRKKLISKLSIGLFIFLPLFALAFKLLYFRKRMNYMEHLVFVFHTQTVFFLLMTMYILISLITDFESLWPFMLLFLIYLYMALRKFYQQSRIKTFVKFVLLNIIYSQLGGFALAVMSIIAFMFD